MEALTRHFDPYAMAEPKSTADVALILGELELALQELNGALNDLEAVLERMNGND